MAIKYPSISIVSPLSALSILFRISSKPSYTSFNVLFSLFAFNISLFLISLPPESISPVELSVFKILS